MFDVEVTAAIGRDDPLYVPVTSVDIELIRGSGRMLGWSLRDAANDVAAQAEGTVVAPGAGATIATTGALAAGTYNVQWTVELIGAAAAADANNFVLADTAGNVLNSLNLGAAGEYPQPQAQVTVAAGNVVLVKAVGAGTAGVTYGASLTLIPSGVPQAVVEIQDGPRILGEASMESEKVHNKDLGRIGVPFFYQVKLHIVQGIITGVVYALYGSP